MKALVVEDDEATRTVLSKVLSRVGYTCIEAATGDDALQAVQDGPVDVVVTDLIMPGMNGLEFIARLREAMPDVPIVVAAGFHSLKACMEALKRGADEYVVKPFGIQQIGYAIERAKERRRYLSTEGASPRDALRESSKGVPWTGDRP